jgi:hypothetical protein
MTPRPSADRPGFELTTRWIVLFNGMFVVLGVGSLIAGALGAGLAAWLIGASALLTGLLLGGSMLAARRRQHRVRAEIVDALRSSLAPAGVTVTVAPAGVAVVLALTETGISISDDPMVRFTVRVTPADGSAEFTSEFTQVVSRIAVPRPGDHCPVRYTATDRSRVHPTGPFTSGPVAGSPPRGSPAT